jgi:hypothetical protein
LQGAIVARAFWAAELTGQPNDLAGWQALLREPFEPRVEPFFALGLTRTVLKSSEFEKMTTASEVRERARIMIENLNGALRALSGTERVELGGVLEVDTCGRVDTAHFGESGSYLFRGRPAALAVGGNSPITPQPSAAQKWIECARTNDVVADMLIHFGKAPSWYDLYKTYEGVKDLCGGEASLKQKSWVPPKLKNFTHTASCYRHGLSHSSNENPPSNPMKLAEATELIATMVSSIMSELAP